MVIAYTNSPHYGFYNRGLALAYSRHGEDVLFERAVRYKQIGFKIKSRYLEHTLSRETIMRDANYEKAMVLLDDAVNQQLLGKLCEEIAALAALEHWRHEDARRYMHLMGILMREPAHAQLSISHLPLLRTIHGTPLSLEQVFETWDRDGRVLFTQDPSALTTRLNTMGVPVIYGMATHSEHMFMAPRILIERFVRYTLSQTMTGRMFGMLRMVGLDFEGWRKKKLDEQLRNSLVSPEQAFLPVLIADEISPTVKTLLDRTNHVLEKTEAGYASLAICQMGAYMEDAPLFVIAPELATFMARPPAHLKRKKAMQVAVNADHPLFQQLASLGERHSEMASYMLAKNLLLEEDRMLERDLELIHHLRSAS